MLLPGRHGSVDSYRYGFNGKEKDDEVKGEGVQYDYGFRIYDARLGKFLSVDPLFQSYPWLTPFQFASNTPIQAIDLDGLESKIIISYKDQDPIFIKKQGLDDLQFMHQKAAYYHAYAGHAGWVKGQEQYENSSKGWTGPGSGTLIIDATGKTVELYYEDSNIVDKFSSAFSSSTTAMNTWFFDSSHLVEGSKDFQQTFWTYTSTFAIELLAEATVVGGITYLTRVKNGNKAIEALSKTKTTSIIGRLSDIDEVAKKVKIVSNVENKGGLTRLKNDKAWNKIVDKFKDIKDDKEKFKKIGDEWWEQYNKPWLDKAIERGDDILDVSKPIKKNLQHDNGLKTLYAREREYLKSNGYKQEGSRWIKK